MIRSFYIQTASPRDGDPGAIREGWYIVSDDEVILTDADGKPLSVDGCRCKLRPGEDELAVAKRLLRANTRPRSDFNRKLGYVRVVY
jgi:hypothetical protein